MKKLLRIKEVLSCDKDLIKNLKYTNIRGDIRVLKKRLKKLGFCHYRGRGECPVFINHKDRIVVKISYLLANYEVIKHFCIPTEFILISGRVIDNQILIQPLAREVEDEELCKEMKKKLPKHHRVDLAARNLGVYRNKLCLIDW